MTQPSKCTGCGSTGFGPSDLGPGRCEFCDGTEGGNPPTGWWWPLNSKKAHWMGADGRSLCGKWMTLGDPELERGNDSSKDNCAECRRKQWARTHAHGGNRA